MVENDEQSASNAVATWVVALQILFNNKLSNVIKKGKVDIFLQWQKKKTRKRKKFIIKYP